MLVKIVNDSKVEFLNLYGDEVCKFILDNDLKTENENGIWSNNDKSISVLIYDDGIINIKGMHIWCDDITKEHLIENYSYTKEQLDDMCKFSCSLPSTEDMINKLYS